ncbi:hypothetical protein PHLH7_59990 [Pseudomonas sp. Ost2]|nr:hypothetical protein PHLH7_59990 [Pseudomonas sp. Ost2]
MRLVSNIYVQVLPILCGLRLSWLITPPMQSTVTLKFYNFTNMNF